jgi:hypothetical protein
VPKEKGLFQSKSLGALGRITALPPFRGEYQIAGRLPTAIEMLALVKISCRFRDSEARIEPVVTERHPG